MFTLLDLLPGQGTNPTFDAQSVPDNTDESILAAIGANFGSLFNDANRAAPVVTPCTATVTNTNATALSTLTGTQTLVLTGGSAGMPTSGFVKLTSTGGGTAYIGYNGLTGGLQNCFYISGGSLNVGAGATMSSIMAVSVTNGWISVGNTNPPYTQLAAQAISVQNVGGTAWHALPASASDRKDTLVSATNGTLSIVQGTPCGTLDWTRLNGTYGAPPPVKAPWVLSTPVTLQEIYVPGVGSTKATANDLITAGMLTAKDAPMTYPTLHGSSAVLTGGADVALTTSMATIMTLTLVPGVHFVWGAVLFELTTAATTSEVELQIVSGTGTILAGFTFGLTAGEVTLKTVSGLNTIDTQSLPLGLFFTTNNGGTFLIQAKKSGAGTVTAKATTPTSAIGGSLGGPSGVIALRWQ